MKSLSLSKSQQSSEQPVRIFEVLIREIVTDNINIKKIYSMPTYLSKNILSFYRHKQGSKVRMETSLYHNSDLHKTEQHS